MKEFPFDMYHVAYGAVTVNSDGDVENCKRNGFDFEPPEKTNVAYIKSKIAACEADLAQLKINLIHAEKTEAKKKKETVPAE